MEQKPQQKKLSGLMSLLAFEATDDCRRLLKEYNQPAARNREDLEYKLATLFRNAPDKRELEKKICDIHPHKAFILKYTEKPKQEETHIEAPNGALLTEDSVKQILKDYIGVPKDNWSNCEGSQTCNCHKFSSFSGQTFQPRSESVNTTTLVIGVLGILGIAAMLYMHSKNSK